MKGVNIFLADGFEDMEALAVNDVLRRGGVRTELISIGEDPFVASSHGITIGVESFLPFMEIDHSGTGLRDVMIFPGGMPGSKRLAACAPLVRAMRAHYNAGGTVAAICAAPGLVLGQLEDWEGKVFTCFDGFQEVPVAKGGLFVPKAAITDGQMITGRSAGHAVSFGLEILKRVKGEEVAADVARSLYLDTHN